MTTKRQAELACEAVGPWIKTSEQYESQAICNRVATHEGPHRQYSRDTFAVLAEWGERFEPDERKYRKIGDDDAATTG